LSAEIVVNEAVSGDPSNKRFCTPAAAVKLGASDADRREVIPLRQLDASP
jgi:hypothetical protein